MEKYILFKQLEIDKVRFYWKSFSGTLRYK